MERILYPETVNGTVRFFFKNKISDELCQKLIANLRMYLNEFSEYNSDEAYYKFINYQEKSSIEITPKYISFFPESKFNSCKEELRKKIYEVVALKSDVYIKTARDNYRLGLSSLLSGDLRSTANLFYYSFHKFYSSSLYNYLNIEGELSDDKILIEEIRHFGDRLYTNNIDRLNLPNNLDEHNYLNILTSRANPFLLTRVIFDESHNDFLNKKLQNYIQYICLEKWSINIFDGEYKNEVIRILNSLNIEDSEYEINKALLTILNNLEFATLNTMYLMLDFIGLRLYWLRQTADYDFDFEVKTNVREFCILADTLESVLYDYEWVPRFYRGFALNKKDDIEKENIVPTIEFYSSNIPFDPSINFKTDKSVAYFSALHINPDFDKDIIIEALNLSENARNEGDYFVVYFSDNIHSEFFVHISRDGRWFCWMETVGYNIEVSYLLNREFKLFLANLIETIEKITPIKQEYKIIATKIEVQYSISEEDLNFKALISNQENINFELSNKESLITESISDFFEISNADICNNFIILGEVGLAFNLIIMNEDVQTIVSKGFNYLIDNFTDSLNIKSLVNINLCISEEIDSDFAGLINYITRKFYSNFSESFKTMDMYLTSNNVFLTINELNEIIIDKRIPSKMTDKIFGYINNHIYFHLKQNKFSEDYKYLLESICIEGLINIYPATLGMWYFRNPNIPIEESFTYGSINYEKVKENFPDLLDNIEYNYNFELGLCCFNSGFLIPAKDYFTRSKKHLNNLVNEGYLNPSKLSEIDDLIIAIEEAQTE